MRAALVVFGMVGVVHLLAQLTGSMLAADLTQVLLMPLLGAALWAGTSAPRPALVRLVLVALSFSWAGDTFPRVVGGDAGFLGMLGSFLCAQLVYALAFWPWRACSRATSPRAALPYLLVALAIIVVSAPGAGGLLPAVVAYAAVLCAMALLATGLGRIAAIGGGLFVVSDSLIALDAFGTLTLPAHGAWVMATYLLAQLLLVLAVRRAGPPPTEGARRRH